VLALWLGDSKYESITVQLCLHHQGSGNSGRPVYLFNMLDTQSRLLRRWCIWKT